MAHVARYSVTFGLSGCYMPDSHYGAIECATRRELANAIRHALEIYDLPKSLIREVKLTRLWKHIRAHGSSSAHFSLNHGANALSFHGLTEDEYREADASED